MKVRVLVVDDSAVVRKLLADVLASDPELELVGTAAHGRIALSKIPHVHPDIVIMDVEMPELGGIETLDEIKHKHPDLPVIMFSALTERGAIATLDALAHGATDYVAKPSKSIDVEDALRHVREELVPKIKAVCPKTALRNRPPSLTGTDRFPRGPLPSGPSAPAESSIQTSGEPVDVVAIGASTGGPNALAQVLTTFGSALAVPVVVVQHMPPVFTRHFAQRLGETLGLCVKEGSHGEPLEPGRVYVAPGDHHMSVRREESAVVVQVDQGAPESSCRPAVDVLFRSVADTFGARALGVVLTGMGQDGCLGAKRLREVGAAILVQDERTSVVWGMPGAVARAGLADRVLALTDIGAEITRRVGERPRRLVRP